MDVLALRDRVAARYPEYLAALQAMVDIDCGSYTPAGVNRVVDLCEERFLGHGWEVDRRAHLPADGDPQLGDLLIGTLSGSGGPRVLMVGHTDTVFDEGTVAERPFRIEGDVARGPGVSDMKGGLLTGFFAIHALQDAGFDRFERITYVCNPDEEIGSPFSAATIRELAPQHDVAFVLEGARANGDIVSARKGTTDFTITFTGRAAHAGVEPEKGRHAVLAAAQAVVALQAMNGRWPGVTVNAGVIHGGTRMNVVPASCSVQVDLRSPSLSTLLEAEAAIAAIGDAVTVPDVSVDVVGQGSHRPMEKGPDAQRLVDLAMSLARELGFELKDAATGGASDANTTSAAGTPTIDGLGPIGGDDHAPAEWLDLTSVVPRTSMLAGLIANL